MTMPQPRSTVRFTISRTVTLPQPCRDGLSDLRLINRWRCAGRPAPKRGAR